MFKKSKQITFYYTDWIEKQSFEPIAQEAMQRNFSVRFTSDLSESSQVGMISCANARLRRCSLSIVMLHGLDQGRFTKPNFWAGENWSTFDVGLLPGHNWAEKWRDASLNPRAHPRLGVSVTGWPKSDKAVAAKRFTNLVEVPLDFSKLKKKTILYAPGVETGGKQVDVVNAIRNLNVNLVIKHWVSKDDKSKYPDLYNNIKLANQYALNCRGNNKITIVDPQEDIFKALLDVDLLITDESSVSMEASILGIPVLSVQGWPMRMNNSDAPRLNVIPKEVLLTPQKKDLELAIRKALASPNQYVYNIINDISFLGYGAEKTIDIIEKVLHGQIIEVLRLSGKHQPNKLLYIWKLAIPYRLSQLSRVLKILRLRILLK